MRSVELATARSRVPRHREPPIPLAPTQDFASGAGSRDVPYTIGMGWPAEKILAEALKLDPEDRALIAAELSEPVEDPEEVRRAWVRLAIERLEKLERGEAKTVGWDEVQDRLQKILDR